MKRPRDSQRQRVYDAETLLAKSPVLQGWGRMLPTVEDCTVYAEKVLADKWVRTWWPEVADWALDVQDGRSRRSASGRLHRARPFRLNEEGDVAQLKFPKPTRWEQIVLHEIAHCIASPQEKAAHGREFVAVYLKLTQRFRGPAIAARLRRCFRKTGAKWYALRPGTRPDRVGTIGEWTEEGP